jgi:UPF0176 protein
MSILLFSSLTFDRKKLVWVCIFAAHKKLRAMDPNGGKKGMFNKLGRPELLKKLEAENFERKTISFYRYVIIENPDEMRDTLYNEWTELNCLGRIYVATEGINAQMNVPEQNWDKFVEVLFKHQEFKGVPFKAAVEEDGNSFLKLAVKVRKQIVADGLPENEYDVTDVGKHLTAQEWNSNLDKSIVVDMRNHYESEIGKFENAIAPQAETFKEELPEVLEDLKGKEDEKILLYCTGGIRCEKTSAYLKHHGFKDVNQLHGGIIDYHRQVEAEKIENKFKGVNFVFDERLGENINGEIISECHQCGKPSASHVNCANKACNLLFIQCDECVSNHEGCCTPECVEVIHMSDEEQKEYRKKNTAKKIFHNHEKVDLRSVFKD